MPQTPEDRVAELESQLRVREWQLEAVHAISEALFSKIDVDALVGETLRVAAEAVGADAGSIILHDPDDDALVFRYVLPKHSAGLVGFTMETTQGIAGVVFGSRETLILDDVSQAADHLAGVDEKVGLTTRNMITLPLMRPGGDPIGVMQILNKDKGQFTEEDRELLEILAAQAAMVLENARLAEKERLAEVVNRLGDVSHDIKNMLTPVQGGAETLDAILEETLEEADAALADQSISRDELAARLAAHLDAVRETYPLITEMVLEGSAQVQARVREIVDCVRGIVAEPRFEWADAGAIAARVAQYLEMGAVSAGVGLRVEAADDLPLAPLDPNRVRDAIYNLVDNAIPETPAGGTIAIRLLALPEGTFPEGGCLVIEVEDTGNGMTEEVRSRLFTDQVESTKSGGTGLGTRIVKNAVDVHGGTIDVASELGKGTTFTIRLPLKRDGMAEPST